MYCGRATKTFGSMKLLDVDFFDENAYMGGSNWIAEYLSNDIVKAISAVGAAAGGLFGISRILKRNKQFSEHLAYIFQGFFFSITQKLFKNAAAYFSLKRYCILQLSGTSKDLHVPGAKDLNLEIDKIFVPLILVQGGVQRTYDHTSIFSAGQRVRIIGDPGSGKSSIAKRIFRDECRTGIRSPTIARFPILLQLRKLSFKEYREQKSAAIDKDKMLDHNCQSSS
jgi:hypothetical protein